MCIRNVALLAAVILAGQAQPAFRSGTTTVEINVVVRDRDGRFIHGLTPDDFQIIEEGRPREIESMYLVAGPDAATRRAGEAVAADARQAPRTFVFAFDVDQMSPRSLTRARDAALAFARERMGRDDAAGLAVLGGESESRAIQGRDAVIAALRALQPSSSLARRERPLREWPRVMSVHEAVEIANGNERALSEARSRECRAREMDCMDSPGAAGGAPAGGKSMAGFKELADRELTDLELQTKSRTYVTETRAIAMRALGGLASLARSLEDIRGRKTIVWFTEGTPLLETANQARETAARAAQSGVAVYTIDPRGLQSRTAGVEEVGTQDVGHDIFSDRGDLPALIASGTGGRFIRNENRLDRALASIENDTSTYYVIGYAAGAEPDRSKRQLTVRVTRVGLDARVRHGFMAPQHVRTTAGSMHAAPLTSVPGNRRELAAPTAPALTPSPPNPPSTSTTVPTLTHVPTTDKVLRLRGLSGQSSSELSARAWAAYERGNLEAALPLFEQAASRPDVQPWALYALGFTYVGLNRSRDAIAVWDRVRAAAPDFQPVYLDLAAHHAQLSDEAKALEMLRAAERRWPSDLEIHNGIGVLMARRGALGDAIASFTKATELTPSDPLSWLNLGRVYELRYDRQLRYDAQLLKWVGPEGDRMKAQQSYQRCVALGGPYAAQASEALSRMAWSQ